MKIFLYSLLIYVIFSSCSFTKNVNTGASAFERKQFSVAVGLFHNEYKSSNRQEIKAEKAFYIGRCYERMNDDLSALEWYSEAVDLKYGMNATKLLAFTLKKLERYDEAISMFRQWEREGASLNEVRREITICEQAKDWKKSADELIVEVSALDFNSPSAEYAPVIFDRNFLVFTSDRSESTGDNTYNWTGNQFSDLFISMKDGSDIRPFDEIINTENNEGAATFTKDFSEIYFTRCFSPAGDDYCKIFWSQQEGFGWTDPIQPFYMERNVNYGQPTLVENDSVLIFSSDQADGMGGYDLFYAVREEEGWSSPFPMPESINTEGDEKFPVGYEDTLYFSSDYLPGLGGLDIFKTYLTEGGRWTPPQNLRSPINSGADDFSYMIDYTSPSNSDIVMQGFFSSSREGFGNDDIYRFEKRKKRAIEDPKEPEVTVESPVKDINFYLAVRVVENNFEIPNDPNSQITGKIPISASSVEVIRNGALEDVKFTNSNGRLVLELEEDDELNFKASKAEYLNNQGSFAIANIERKAWDDDVTFNIEIVLDKIFKDTEINLSDIFYEFNEWFIREDAKPSLNYLVNLLENNPQIRIQLGSHTDCRGEDNYNLDLSQKRAQSAIDYINSNGIPRDRLEAMGYGESRLAINCVCQLCTEDQHQQNRRTTFKIVN